MQQIEQLITIKEASHWASNFLSKEVSEYNISYDFKRNVYFKAGDIILDPFSDSGTTLVQAHEIGIHAIGIDISRFNQRF